MPAVAEAARFRDRVDVGERRRQRVAGFPELQLAHARRVDQHAVRREQDQLPVGAGVTAAAIGHAHVLGAQQVVADEPIDDRRLAHTRGAEQCAGPARSEVGAQRVYASAVPARDRVHRHRGRQRPDLFDVALRIVDEVRLVQHDDRGGAALPGDEEVALDPAWVEITIEAADEEHDVDVGGNDLFLGAIAGRASREAARSRQDGDNPRVTVPAGRLDGDPVADRGKVRASFRTVAQAP